MIEIQKFFLWVHQVVLLLEYVHECKSQIKAQNKTRYLQNDKNALSFKKIRSSIHEY